MHEFDLIKNYFQKLSKKSISSLNLNDDVFFDNITGALGVGTAGAGQTQIENCKIFYYPATSNGLCVLELLN